MNQGFVNPRSCSLRRLIDIFTTTALMGVSALAGMLALEYLVTGSFGAAMEYSAIALLITLGLTALQWRRYRMRQQSGSRHGFNHSSKSGINYSSKSAPNNSSKNASASLHPRP